MGIEFITDWLDKIPGLVGIVRGLVETILSVLNLPLESTYTLAVAGIALVGAYFWLKQWVTTSLFLKISTLLNYLLLALLIYTLLVYV